MKVVILAGGKGTRMMPLTKHKPKVMVDVMGAPFLEWTLDSLEDAGIGDVAIVTGYKAEALKEYINFIADDYVMNFTFIHQAEQLGTGHALSLCEEFIDKDSFLLINGDCMFHVADIIRMMENHHDSVVSGITSDHPEDYGALLTDGNMLIDVVEKPKKHITDMVNAGMYKFNHRIFAALKKIGPSERGEIELTDALRFLIHWDTVYVHTLQHYWLELGCPADVEKIEKFFL